MFGWLELTFLLPDPQNGQTAFGNVFLELKLKGIDPLFVDPLAFLIRFLFLQDLFVLAR